MKNEIFFNKTTKRKFLKILGVSLIAPVGFAFFNIHKNNNKKSYWRGSVLGVPSKVELHSSNTDLNHYLVEEIESLVKKYENTFNIQNNQSEISMLNKYKYLKNPSTEIIDVINKAKLISTHTNGLFDITVQPLWKLYYEHFIIDNKITPPNSKKIKDVLELVNWRNVVIEKNEIVLKNNSSITLNGIAQGWITDQIKMLLSKNGYNNTLVDFGENYASGLFEKKRPWNILVKGQNASQVVSLTNKAIATSAGYGTSFESSIQHHHIFNTKNGKSSNNYKSVSIISDRAWMADSVSTASLSMTKNQIENICKRLNLKALVQKNSTFEEIS
ncbi:MAG: FAD:protein FMN transferase [Pseudomonadota bacterium]|nr:FAD:protein FMN transferase [Pseudomonadota bacterium]